MSVTGSKAANRRILCDMLAIPTAPFAEHLVIDFIERFCGSLKKPAVSRDSAGNILVHIRQGRRAAARPVCITAHLDHPGFVADRMLSSGRLRAFWRGGVPKEYFRGSRVRLWVEDSWVKGRIVSIKTVRDRGKQVVDTAVISVPRAIPGGSIGMWDFADPTIRGTRIHARGCDDLAGAAAMLCCLDQLVRRRTTCDAYFLFTRAEEVGFVGAVAAARLGTIPRECFVVAMETSSELPDARMGRGPILRVGDRSSVFTSEATAHCNRVAVGLAARDRRFTFQRKLMDGGTCESSAYCVLGYEATGMCLALGNYHNVNAGRKRLAPEYIDLDDFDKVVKWFVELSRAAHPYTGRDDTLRSLIRTIERKYAKLLRSSVKAPR